jgi:hypothetical protein
MAQTWRLLAGSFQFVESLEQFLLDFAQAPKVAKGAGRGLKAATNCLPACG